MAMSIFHPFPDHDSFGRMLQFLEGKALCNASIANKGWLLGITETIKKWTVGAGLAQVDENVENKRPIRNYVVLSLTGAYLDAFKNDYRQNLGEPVGNPMVTVYQIDELWKSDAQNPKKKKCETFRAVARFEAVIRTLGKGEKAIYDESTSNLRIESPDPESEPPAKRPRFEIQPECQIKFGMSISNAIMLFAHPINGKGNKVIKWVNENVYRQCRICLENSDFEFIGREISKESREKTWAEQRELFPLAGALTQLISCGFDIRKQNTCAYVPTAEYDYTLANTSDYFISDNESVPVALGGFVPDEGVCIDSSISDYFHGVVPDSCDYPDEFGGALPVIPAE